MICTFSYSILNYRNMVYLNNSRKLKFELKTPLEFIKATERKLQMQTCACVYAIFLYSYTHHHVIMSYLFAFLLSNNFLFKPKFLLPTLISQLKFCALILKRWALLLIYYLLLKNLFMLLMCVYLVSFNTIA